MEENNHKGIFKAIVYFENMEYPVQVEVEYNDKEAESIRKAISEHNTEEDWPYLYDLERHGNIRIDTHREQTS